MKRFEPLFFAVALLVTLAVAYMAWQDDSPDEVTAVTIFEASGDSVRSVVYTDKDIETKLVVEGKGDSKKVLVETVVTPPPPPTPPEPGAEAQRRRASHAAPCGRRQGRRSRHGREHKQRRVCHFSRRRSGRPRRVRKR